MKSRNSQKDSASESMTSVGSSSTQEPRFILDFSLHRVAKQLRLLGLDAECASGVGPAAMLAKAQKESRILITGSKKILPRVAKVNRYVIDGVEQQATSSAAIELLPETSCAVVQIAKKKKTDVNKLPPERHVPHKTLVGYNSDGQSEYETDSTLSTESSTGDVIDELLSSDDDQEETAETAKNHFFRENNINDQHTAPLVEETDVVCSTKKTSNTTQQVAAEEERYINCIYVQTHEAFEVQMRHILHAAKIHWNPQKIFTRCVSCNVLILAVPDKEKIRELVNPTVFRIYENFYQCPQCLKVYWGMDNGVLINYKALRTVQYLEQYCLPPAAKDGPHHSASTNSNSSLHDSSAATSGGFSSRTGLGRHLLALPRGIKVGVMGYLQKDALDALSAAFPMLTELCVAVATGADASFKRTHPKIVKLRKSTS